MPSPFWQFQISVYSSLGYPLIRSKFMSCITCTTAWSSPHLGSSTGEKCEVPEIGVSDLRNARTNRFTLHIQDTRQFTTKNHEGQLDTRIQIGGKQPGIYSWDLPSLKPFISNISPHNGQIIWNPRTNTWYTLQ